MDRTSALQLTTVSVPLQLPVFCCDLSAEFQTELSLAKEAVQELLISHPESITSNVKATYSSSYKSHLLNAKLIPLTELVIKLAKKASKETLSCDLDSINVDLFTADCWCAIYEESDQTIPHNHFPSDFSAVVYLEAEADSAPIIFANSILVKPVAGSLVLFPGILQHHVPPTKARRVIVAMNIFKVPRFKNQDQ
jgi:hypothetical protein